MHVCQDFQPFYQSRKYFFNKISPYLNILFIINLRLLCYLIQLFHLNHLNSDQNFLIHFNSLYVQVLNNCHFKIIFILQAQFYFFVAHLFHYYFITPFYFQLSKCLIVFILHFFKVLIYQFYGFQDSQKVKLLHKLNVEINPEVYDIFVQLNGTIDHIKILNIILMFNLKSLNLNFRFCYILNSFSIPFQNHSKIIQHFYKCLNIFYLRLFPNPLDF